VASVNNWTVSGNIVRDPYIKKGPDGTIMNIGFTIAGDKTIKGETRTTYVEVVAYGRTAESAIKYGIRKGDYIVAIGEAGMKSYDKKDGGQGYNLQCFAREIISFSRHSTPTVSDVVRDSDVPF
jgi:single-stranded DNA-binding protein